MFTTLSVTHAVFTPLWPLQATVIPAAACRFRPTFCGKRRLKNDAFDNVTDETFDNFTKGIFTMLLTKLLTMLQKAF